MKQQYIRIAAIIGLVAIVLGAVLPLLSAGY